MEDTQSHSSGADGTSPAGLIESKYTERFTQFVGDDYKTSKTIVKEHVFQTVATVPKTGVMFVGLGGNNGSTLTAALLAHRKHISWESRRGTHEPNFFGSFTQCASAHAGYKVNAKTGALDDVHMPVKDILPMVEPVDLVIGGWDISN